MKCPRCFHYYDFTKGVCSCQGVGVPQKKEASILVRVLIWVVVVFLPWFLYVALLPVILIMGFLIYIYEEYLYPMYLDSLYPILLFFTWFYVFYFILFYFACCAVF